MTDLIPREAAIAAVNLAIWKSPIKAQISTIDASNDTAEVLRAIPTIDPAAIREAALREAAYVAINACLVPPDGGSPTEAERLVCEEAHRRILALIGEKK